MNTTIESIRQDDESTICIEAFDGMTISVYPDGDIFAMESCLYTVLDEKQTKIIKRAVNEYLL